MEFSNNHVLLKQPECSIGSTLAKYTQYFNETPLYGKMVTVCLRNITVCTLKGNFEEFLFYLLLVGNEHVTLVIMLGYNHNFYSTKLNSLCFADFFKGLMESYSYNRNWEPIFICVSTTSDSDSCFNGLLLHSFYTTNGS